MEILLITILITIQRATSYGVVIMMMYVTWVHELNSLCLTQTCIFQKCNMRDLPNLEVFLLTVSASTNNTSVG